MLPTPKTKEKTPSEPNKSDGVFDWKKVLI